MVWLHYGRPTAAKGAANADDVAFFEVGHRFGDAARFTNCMQQDVGFIRVGTNGDGYFAQAREMEHVKLPRQEAIVLPNGRVSEGESVGGDVGCFVMDLFDDGRFRHHWVSYGRCRMILV